MEPEDDENAEGILLTRIVIERRLHDTGDLIWTRFTSGDDDDTPPLYEVLGLLELAKDTAIRDAMGETPPPDIDPEYEGPDE